MKLITEWDRLEQDFVENGGVKTIVGKVWILATGLSLMIVLTGCSTTEGYWSSMRGYADERPSNTNAPSGSWTPAPAMQPAPIAAPASFSPDDEATLLVTSQGTAWIPATDDSVSPYQGLSAPNDPNVIVYPFDDQQSFSPIGAGLLPMTSPVYAAYAERGYGTGIPTRLYFKHGSATLDAADRHAIKTIADSYRFGQTVTVAGHASIPAEVKDPAERKIRNLKVSLDRAFNTTQALIRHGVPAEAIETEGWGETRPAQSGVGSGTDAENRRVEIFSGYHY
ncbi:MAG: OmpA family protein [Alphaproteobacteria bacterium]|nr:OmpA family protein [Alphaproteobacteria bacterium]